jgi:hypothetical protein
MVTDTDTDTDADADADTDMDMDMDMGVDMDMDGRGYGHGHKYGHVLCFKLKSLLILFAFCRDSYQWRVKLRNLLLSVLNCNSSIILRKKVQLATGTETLHKKLSDRLTSNSLHFLLKRRYFVTF